MVNKLSKKQYDLNPTLCKHCNTIIKYEKRTARFCSKSCSSTYNNLLRIKKPAITVVACATCSKPVPRHRRRSKKLGKIKINKICCSRQCYNFGKINKKTGKTNNKTLESKYVCYECSSTFESKYQRDFCAKACRTIACSRKSKLIGQARREANVLKWKKGLISGNTKWGNLPKFIRYYILEKFNYKCSQCQWSGVNPITGQSTLQIDHIDGDWRNCTENNLRTLCPNCHSLTPTYGPLNKGKGRPYRYEHFKKIEGLGMERTNEEKKKDGK